MITLTILFTILITGPQFVNLVNANFKPYQPPSITIFSPSSNQIYNSSKILLDVNADIYGGYPNPIAYNNLTSLNYSLDGQPDIPIPIGRSVYGLVIHEKFTLSNLSDGVHSVFVHSAR